MNNRFENFAIFLVVLLLLTIVGLIVQYNLVEEKKNPINITKLIAQLPNEKKTGTKEYLEKLEQYEEKDVNANPAEYNSGTSNTVNMEAAKIELKNDDVVNEISAIVDQTMGGE